MRPPHDYFNRPLDELSKYLTLDNDCEKIAEDINKIFKKDNIFCYLFPHRIFDVKGFLAKFNDNEIFILFFEYKDYNGNFFDIFG